MPDFYILLPFDENRPDLAAGKEGPRRLDRRSEAGVPAGEQGSSGLPGHSDQGRKFANRRARRLFQQHMLAGLQRGRRLGVAHLRRCAERNGIDIARTFEQFVERRVMGDAIDGGIAADNGGEFDARGLGNRGNVLVFGNLSETNDGNAYGSHGNFSRLLRTNPTGFTIWFRAL